MEPVQEPLPLKEGSEEPEEPLNPLKPEEPLRPIAGQRSEEPEKSLKADKKRAKPEEPLKPLKPEEPLRPTPGQRIEKPEKPEKKRAKPEEPLKPEKPEKKRAKPEEPLKVEKKGENVEEMKIEETHEPKKKPRNEEKKDALAAISPRGPLVPQPAQLPEVMQQTGKVPVVPESEGLVRVQAHQRKTKRDNQKLEEAAKEVEKERKVAEREAKEKTKQEKQLKKLENKKAEAEKAFAKLQAKLEEKNADKKKKPAKGTTGGDGEEVRKSKGIEAAPKAKSRQITDRLTATPCKVWNPHGGTPKKVKARKKREEKALAALSKLRRQKELLTETLVDLQEPTDESKMQLDKQYFYKRCSAQSF